MIARSQLCLRHFDLAKKQSCLFMKAVSGFKKVHLDCFFLENVHCGTPNGVQPY